LLLLVMSIFSKMEMRLRHTLKAKAALLQKAFQKTDYLVNNDVNSTSSKNKKAKDLEILIISEDTFVTMFGKQ